MGKVLRILGVVFVLLVGGFVALLVWSHEKGEAVQSDFYALVGSGDPQRLVEALHPALREKVDAPVLKVWMDAVAAHLGRFEGLAASSFSTSSKTENGVTTVESEGKVRFEKGEARSKLTLVDGKVEAFYLKADALPEAWLTTSPDPASYAAAGEEFLTLLLEDHVAEARARMHENLQAKMPEADLAQGVKGVHEQIGALVKIEKTDEAFEAQGTPALTVRYAVTGERGTAHARVRFEFTPWKGHLVAFDVKVD